MSPVLGAAASTQLRFTVQGPPSPPVVDMPPPASGVDMLLAPPASGPGRFPLAGALASVSLPLAAMPSATALASSEEVPLSVAVVGPAPESSPSPWLWGPKPGPLEDWEQPAANAAQNRAANA